MPRPVLETGVRFNQDGIRREVVYHPAFLEYRFIMWDRELTAQHRADRRAIETLRDQRELFDYENTIWRSLAREIRGTRLRSMTVRPPEYLQGVSVERIWMDDIGSSAATAGPSMVDMDAVVAARRAMEELDRTRAERRRLEEWGNPLRVNREADQQTVRDLADIFREEYDRPPRALPGLRNRHRDVARSLPG